MKFKSLGLLFVLLISLVGCRYWGVRGSGNIDQEYRDIKNFSEIELAGAYTVDIRVGEEPSLKINAEDNILQYIRTTVRGDRLIIDTKRNISPRKEIKIKITTRQLDYLESSGASSIYVDNIRSDRFYVELSGAGSIDLSGDADRLKVDMSGAGSLDAKNLRTRETKVNISGASSADVYATEYLDASVSGVGSIEYYGNPEKVRTDVSGIGSINRR
jgi:hypothetical protein